MKNLKNWATSREAIARTTGGVSFGLLMLRIGAGLMMALSHGWGKLTGFAERSATFADPFGLGSTVSLSFAVFAEVFCAIAIVFGLLTRLAVIPLIITMAVAGFIIHGNDPWPKPEMALLYLTVFLTLLFAGPGKLSVDRLFGR